MEMGTKALTRAKLMPAVEGGVKNDSLVIFIFFTFSVCKSPKRKPGNE